MKSAVITGLGPVSAIGIGIDEFSNALRAGRSGITPIASFATEGLPFKEGGEIRDFQVDRYLQSQKAYLDRTSEFTLAAVALALQDARLDLQGIDRTRVGLLLGSAFGCLASMRLFYEGVLEKGPRFAKPMLFPHTYPNTAISLTAIEFGIQGEHVAFSSGRLASGHALLAALELIREERATFVLAGGADSLNPMIGYAFHALPGYRFADPANGLHHVPGEGAGVLLVEELEHAQRRGARIYARLTGEACTSVATPAAQAIPPGSVFGLCESFFAQSSTPAQASIVARGSVIPACLGEVFGATTALQTIAAASALQVRSIPAALTHADHTGCGAVRDAPFPVDSPVGRPLADEGRVATRVDVFSSDPGGNSVSLQLLPYE